VEQVAEDEYGEQEKAEGAREADAAGGVEINFEHSDSGADVVRRNLLPLHLNPGDIMGLYAYRRSFSGPQIPTVRERV